MSQRPDDQKNLLIAVVLSVAVMLGWQFFYAGPQMKAQQEKAQREKVAQQEAAKAAGENPAAATAPATPGATLPGAQPSGTSLSAAPVGTRPEVLAKTQRVPIETPSLTGSISLKGGLVDDLVLANYRETVDPKSPNVVLFSPLGAPNAYFAEFGWQAAGRSQTAVPDSETVWQAEPNAKLTPSTPVKLTWDNGQGLKFVRTLAIDEHYMITVTDEVQNTTSGDIVLTPYGRLYRFGLPHTSGYAVLHEGLIGVPGDAGLQEIAYAKVLEDGGAKTFDGKTGGWLGITDKYWAATLIPDQKATYAASFRGQPKKGLSPDVFWTDYSLGGIVVAAGATQKTENRLYAGAKQVKLIEDYETSLGIEKFELLVDWGWFYFITKPLYYLIDWLYGILGNFGLAILAVTVIVKGLFFPLANKSYESMAKMKKLQPQMEQLRERYKDDKAKQQQELMALYQKEKINPLAGCLPILVQIPVFFALYKVLFVSIDMRHAPFFGWIRDLSAADPTSIFNLFGLLPFVVPEFLHIGVWPIIMGITMWFQMQLNPPQPDPIQQQIFSFMPLLFTFLLAAFPAGLVIYWAWNNILSIAQQWYISHKQGADVHLVDNLKRTFAPIGRLFGRKSESKG
ncbi:MAG: membrane protein insertase YidC [Hyphomicrobium zavarzinii]|jgi:YidC/Oxa1 family membrane protein insertase|uniref:membrane protein insertase YidC n=1 Tax=Hyphomicrobium TaxID=81 RepID=UPI000377B233|nr:MULTISPECIES: membrane protein insertase YidC [Hyphomicrobium]MBL8847585.1 membrane protein insertase YidC [Hyphomicrobium zavarzinii]WBT38800.1 membrane protein insertase YidC [Hyphomicrobium sp. DMF-1]HML44181.1 membrane protein insertase YidC [Hyphomicrobium zavarzinii]